MVEFLFAFVRLVSHFSRDFKIWRRFYFEVGLCLKEGPEKMDFLTEKQHFISIKKVTYNIWEAKDVLSKTFWITFYLSTVSDSAVSSITHIKIQTKNQFIQSKSARYTRMLPSYFDYLGNWIAVVSDSHWDWYFTWKEPFYKSNQLQCNIKYYAYITSKIRFI